MRIRRTELQRAEAGAEQEKKKKFRGTPWHGTRTVGTSKWYAKPSHEYKAPRSPEAKYEIESSAVAEAILANEELSISHPDKIRARRYLSEIDPDYFLRGGAPASSTIRYVENEHFVGSVWGTSGFVPSRCTDE